MEPIEIVISHLTKTEGVRINKICAAIGIERTAFYTWRKSVSKAKRTELAEFIVQKMPQYFPNGMPAPVKDEEEEEIATVNNTEKRYIQRLEQWVDDLRKEKADLIEQNISLAEKLQQKNEAIIEDLKKILTETKANFIT